MRKYEEIWIAGAGLSGLAAATELGQRRAGILETQDRPGGLVASRRAGGFTFDHTGHLFHLSGPARDFVARRIGSELRTHERRAVVHWDGAWIPYPFQAHLDHLPADVRDECREGLAELADPVDRSSFAAWCRTTFGAGITRHFLRPYNEKLYGRSLEDLTADFVTYIPRPAPGSDAARSGYNARFEYPARGGSGRLIEALLSEVGPVSCGEGIEEIVAGGLPGRGGFRTKRGMRSFGRLLSSIPLPRLVECISDAPHEIRRLARDLRATTVRVLNLGVRGKGPDWHWAYFSDTAIPFYRVGHYTGFSPASAPEGHYALYCEIAEPPGAALWEGDPLATLVSLGLIPDPAAVVVRDEFRIPAAYTLPLPGRGEAVRRITAWCESSGIHPIGRYGRWAYTSMGEAILDGVRTARRAAGGADAADGKAAAGPA